MGGGGSSKKVTNVTNTGLGDQQYADLNKKMDGQTAQGIRHTTLQNDMTRDTVNDGFAASNDLLKDESLATRNTVRGQATQTRDTVRDTANTTQGLVNSTAKATQNAVNSGFNTTNKNLTSGFAGVNSNMNAGFDGLGDQMGTGFASLGNGMVNMNTNMTNGMAELYGQANSNAAAAAQQMGTGFTNLSDLVTGGFSDYAQGLATAKNAIMNGQGQLSDAVAANKQAAATYYDALAAQGADTQAGIQGMQTNLTDFTTGYQDDVTQAQKSRAQLQAGMEGGFANTQELIGNTTNATQAGQERLMDAVGGVQSAQGQQNAAMQQGFAQQQQQAAQGQASFANQIMQVRTALTQNGQQMDDMTRQQMIQVANAFDQQGNLIGQSFDAQGNFITRAMQENGQMLVRSFDQNGMMNNQLMVNVQQILAQAQGMSGVPANASMGGLTTPAGQPQPAPVSGFLPYMQT